MPDIYSQNHHYPLASGSLESMPVHDFPGKNNSVLQFEEHIYPLQKRLNLS